jgi:hypothetical protein
LKVVRKEEDAESPTVEKRRPLKPKMEEEGEALLDEADGRWKGKNPVLSEAVRKTFMNKVRS